MKSKKFTILSALSFASVALATAAAPSPTTASKSSFPTSAPSVASTGSRGTTVGNDADSHGCIPSAGYSYCEATGKCYRPWEESCASASNVPSQAPSSIIGGDKDEHGCIPSAGYSYCEATGKCYRPWEESCASESNVPSQAPSSIIGGDKDEHGCIPSAGYSYCEATGKCYRLWEESCASASNAPSQAPSSQHNPRLAPGSDTDAHGCKASAGEVYCEETQTCIEPSTETCPVANGNAITGPASISCSGTGRCDLSSECQISELGSTEQLGGLYLADLLGDYDVPEGCTVTCVDCSEYNPSSAFSTALPTAVLGALAFAVATQMILFA